MMDAELRDDIAVTIARFFAESDSPYDAADAVLTLLQEREALARWVL